MSELTFHLDTSFAIRILTGDPLPLFEKAADFLRDCSEREETCEVSDLVLAETYHALQYHYGFTKLDALRTLLAFAKHPTIRTTVHAQEILALPGLASAKPGFVDRLIHGARSNDHLTLVTFEKSSHALSRTLVLK
jgi:predicted nucleic acid-binding protein